MRWLPFVLLLGCTPTESMPEPALSPAPEHLVEPVEPVVHEPVAAPPSPELASPTTAPDCDPRAIAAARTALATALAQGLDASMLADCESEQVRCETERRPLERGSSCRMIAYSGNERWETVIAPRPATGAPTRLEIWVDLAGTEAGRVEISGSTFGVVEGVILEGHGEHASHTHGGAPARIGGARFVVENRRDQAIELKLTGTRWLTAHSCELPRDERARPKPAGLALEDGLIDGTMKLTIPKRTTVTVRLGHELQDAYMASCDRFATAASFEIDGEKLEVIAEHRVIRRDPLRR